MIYLKTIFTNQEELELITFQIQELDDLIDRIILIEPSFHHNGKSRKLVGIDSLGHLKPGTLKKIIYLVVPKLDSIQYSEKGEDHHRYETITRGFFFKQLKLKNRDIIISTDADEILYHDIVKNYLTTFKKSILPTRRITFNLYQFFYRFNLYSEDHDFIAPGIYHYGSRLLDRNYYQNGFINWRYSGKVHNGKGGVHLSWIQSEKSLIVKALNWAHSSELDLSEEAVILKIRSDIERKIYSFRTPAIELKVINQNRIEKVWPKTLIQNAENLESRCVAN